MPPATPDRLRRLLALAVFAALAGSLVAALPAAADLLTPESGGSPNADSIDTLYKLILAIAVVVFVGVEGALIWALIKFKARKGAVAAQVHGNTRLEIGWTVGAAAILIFLVVFTFIKLPGIKNPPATGPNGLQTANEAIYASTDQPPPPDGKGLTIKVDGQQYVWRYQYPGPKKVFAYTEMVVPEDTTIILDITSDDVQHSWWIPKLGGKMDALPGYVNHTWFKARRGFYYGQCAELCGRNHPNMIATVRAIPAADYQRWYNEQAARIQTAERLQAEQREDYDQPGQTDAAEGEDTGDRSSSGSAPEG